MTDDLVSTARRRHGVAGAMVAAGLVAMDEALGRRPREQPPVVVASDDEPLDVDENGISLIVDAHTSVFTPALPRTAPVVARSRRRR